MEAVNAKPRGTSRSTGRCWQLKQKKPPLTNQHNRDSVSHYRNPEDGTFSPSSFDALQLEPPALQAVMRGSRRWSQTPPWPRGAAGV
jgi:hypothetical protein